MQQVIHITKALADRNRVRILMALRQGELCLCQIVAMLALAPSTVSKHMSVLHHAGLVESRKDGRWMYFSLPGPEGPEAARGALDWLAAALAEDPEIAADSAALARVCCTPLEELAGCYRG